MKPLLGISIGRRWVHAVIRNGNGMAFVGSAEFDSPADLTEVLGRLAAESKVPVRRARVVLDRDVVQVRTLDDLPRMKLTAVRRAVSLQAARYFRNGHGPVVTDARVIRDGRGRRTVLAAAASADLLTAIAQGCDQAGLVLDAIGPACEIVPLAASDASRATTLMVATAAGTEQLDLVRGVVCRSRLILAGCTPTHEWAPQLASLGEPAGRFATAFSATKARPRMSLLPEHTRARAAAQRLRRVRWLVVAALVAWLMAGVVFLARLRLADARTRADLAASATAAESVRRLRRDLDSANAALTTVRQADASRSSTFLLLERLTGLLGDSVTVVSVRITRDSTLHLAGYAPTADRVVATLEHMQGVERPRLEEPPSRQVLTMADGRRREWDRFAVVAHLASRP